MKFVSIRDLRSNTASFRKELETEREIVLTANGRPFAVMTSVSSNTVEEELLAIRRARARTALSRIRARARAKGLDILSSRQIDALIAKVRRERRASK